MAYVVFQSNGAAFTAIIIFLDTHKRRFHFSPVGHLMNLPALLPGGNTCKIGVTEMESWGLIFSCCELCDLRMTVHTTQSTSHINLPSWKC